MTIVRRVLVLALISVSGIALLAPLAAQSAVQLPSAPPDRLLSTIARPAPNADRGGLLSARLGTDGADLGAAAEALGAAPLPTPASAPMQASIVALAVPTPAPAPQAVVRYDGNTVWDALAQCESGGNWAINTGNGYYGGLQFSLGTWQNYGGTEFAAYPHEATREQQIIVAERLHAARGFSPWPACSAELGLS